MRAASPRERDGILIGVGGGLTLVLLLVLQLLIGSGLFSTRTMTSTTTVTTVSTVPDAYGQLANSHANFLALLNSSDATALKSQYESNATVTWKGAAPGLVGTYSGLLNIGILLGSFKGKFVNFSVSSESLTIAAKGNSGVVNSTLGISAYSAVVGKTSMAIAAEDSYVQVGDKWLIGSETWTFLSFDEQFPVT
jgi:hypothetical protein